MRNEMMIRVAKVGRGSGVIRIVAGLLLAHSALATTYYIDFEKGSDSNVGTAPAAAFKHSPGDPAAGGNVAAVKLQPGDTVLFKGGVAYRGTVKVGVSGSPGKPITFDGNSAGKFGVGKAIIDGSDALTGWTRCASVAEARGNPRWAEIFYIDIPRSGGQGTAVGMVECRSLNLCDAQTALPVAQEPNPADPFFQETASDYFQIHEPLKSVKAASGACLTLTDPGRLTQTDPHYFDGMLLATFAGNDEIFYQLVKGYDPIAHRLTMPVINATLYKETAYAFFNSVKLIDQPGEHSVELAGDPGKIRIFLLPPKVERGQPVEIGVTRYACAFALEGVSHVTVNGFIIRRQNKNGITAEGPGRNIVIRDCEATLIRGCPAIAASRVDDILIERGYVHHNPGACRGIILHTCTNAVTRDCRLVRNTGTALDYYGCVDSQVIGNQILDHRGQHANGLTFYVGCKNILVERNRVAGGSCALTFQQVDGITFRNNIFDSNLKSTVVGIWPTGPIRNVKFLNNTIIRSFPGSNWQVALFTNARKIDGLVVRNNIIDGVCADAMGDVLDTFAKGEFSNNLFTRRDRDVTAGMLKDGLVETDLKKIFVDPDKDDFRLKEGSPAIGAGMDVGLLEDIAGRKIPPGKKPDIGAYQYQNRQGLK